MRNKAVIIILSIFVLLTSCQTVSSVPDYSDPSLWAYYAEGDGLDADLFIIAPTVDMGGDGNSNMSLSDEGTKEAFIGALNMERGIFDEYTAMYSPFYRQMTFPVYDRRESEEGAPLDIAYSDVRNAFIYFLDNISIDRPIIIAGFSQGAQLSLMLLEEFFSDEALQERLVAAYIIGWHVNDTICQSVFQHLFGFLHIGTIRYNLNIGRCIHFPKIFPAQRRMRIVDHYSRHFADRLFGVDESVKQRIEQRHEDEENQSTLVAHGPSRFLPPDEESVAYRLVQQLI